MPEVQILYVLPYWGGENMDTVASLQQLILDSLPHWAMLVDADTRTILEANKLAKELGSTIQGQCWDDFAHRESLSSEDKQILSRHPNKKRDNTIMCTFCEADEAIRRRETVIRDVELGNEIWKTYWVPIKDNIYLHYAIDVTEVRKLEKLKLEKEKLAATIKTIGAITHEVSQPLMVLSGNLDLLMEDLKYALSDEDKVFYNAIEKALIKLTTVVHKLQHVCKVRTKKYLNSEILDIEASSIPNED